MKRENKVIIFLVSLMLGIIFLMVMLWFFPINIE